MEQRGKAQQLRDFVIEVATHLPGWDAYPDDTGWGQSAVLLLNTDYPEQIRVVDGDRRYPVAPLERVEFRWGSRTAGMTIEQGAAKVAAQLHRRIIRNVPQWAADDALAESRHQSRMDRCSRTLHDLIVGLRDSSVTAVDNRLCEGRARGRVPADGSAHRYEAYFEADVTVGTWADPETVPAADYDADTVVTLTLRHLTVEQAQRVRAALTGQPPMPDSEAEPARTATDHTMEGARS